LTTLSVVDKYRLERESSALQRLLDLDGEIMEQGKGFWVEIHAKRVPPSTVKPHGIDYCLCLTQSVRKATGMLRQRTPRFRRAATVTQNEQDQ
jgi:hypothetical protein